MNEEQAMECEVLDSIYTGDENFKKVSESRLQYKLGDGSPKAFLIEIDWPNEYPAVQASIHLDVFFNSHISTEVRNAIRDRLTEVAKENEGMASSFAIIEFAKENFELLTANWKLSNADAIGQLTLEEEKDRKEKQLTKAAKRRMWDRNQGTGCERGYDWIDIIKHLSQTRDN